MTLQYFLSRGLIRSSDAAEVSWCHGVNSRSGLMEALSGSAHMMEADVLMRECDPKEPIMAHPPARDSDITLKEWLQEVKEQQKGIKLDFKSLEAVAPSLVLLEEVLAKTNLPVWINADVLAGPGGHAQPLDPQAFLSAVRDLPPHVVLSLGWTTGWTAGMDNPESSSSPATSPPHLLTPDAGCGPPVGSRMSPVFWCLLLDPNPVLTSSGSTTLSICSITLQLGHGACDGGGVQSPPTPRHLPRARGASGPVRPPAQVVAAAVPQIHSHCVDGPDGHADASGLAALSTRL
ncbi:protein FAM151B-like isoform X1 [Takifugu rubripes]|uniref:protein FAM151B-like isoform X1 n=1 Tax=Takifugu rubripes TaxID=31033 RepID=UPI001145BE85|nr:protein FAM151B-like isoform X1 [Takifugu rubripes]